MKYSDSPICLIKQSHDRSSQCVQVCRRVLNFVEQTGPTLSHEQRDGITRKRCVLQVQCRHYWPVCLQNGMHELWWQRWESSVQVHLPPSCTNKQTQSTLQLVLSETIGLDASSDELLLQYLAESLMVAAKDLRPYVGSTSTSPALHGAEPTVLAEML